MVVTAAYVELVNLSPLVSVFVPTDEKVKKIARHLMEGYLNLSDEYRNYDVIYRMLYTYFHDQSCTFYELGEMQGLLGIVGIIPEFKASVMFKLLDPKLWSATFAREMKDFFKLFMNTIKLKRLSTESPDPRIVKMAFLVGFEGEGMKPDDFSWDGNLYDNYLLGITNRPKKIKKKNKKRRK